MATRRIIYIKNPAQGSNFRTLGGSLAEVKTGSGSKSSPYPKFKPTLPTLPKVTVSVHPDYAKYIPLSPQWRAAQSWLIPGAASPSSYASSFRQFQSQIKTTDWTEFLFENTIFDGDFWQPYGAILAEGQSTNPMQVYYDTAKRAGIENPPPPQYSVPSIFGTSEKGAIKRELWDMFNSDTYWDLDPNND